MLLKAVLIVCVVRKERKENIGLAHASFISLRRAGGRRSGQDGGAGTLLPIGWKSRVQGRRLDSHFLARALMTHPWWAVG